MYLQLALAPQQLAQPPAGPLAQRGAQRMAASGRGDEAAPRAQVAEALRHSAPRLPRQHAAAAAAAAQSSRIE